MIELTEENPNHESRYKLTPYGEVEAQRLTATKGLPFLVMVSSKKAISDGKQRTVKSMADEIIREFPAKLKRVTKANFAFLWEEFANYTAEQYLEEYEEAQS